MTMHLDRFPKLSKDIIKAFQKVHEYKVMPSMRTLQFSGDAILKNNLRGYNCSFTNVDNERVFSEILFLLLSGTGVGYSVQKHHITNLGKIQKPSEEGTFVVHDSIAGWAQALETLVRAYFFSSIRPVFDFSQIRPKGAYLSTTGAKAPGPEPLKHMLAEVEHV
jgi:ribonucleoside-diphosphate reductase alpha chain